jgi:hypothetical protein
MQPQTAGLPEPPKETPPTGNQVASHLQLTPVESLIAADGSVTFTVQGFDMQGHPVASPAAKVVVEGPGSLEGLVYKPAKTDQPYVAMVTVTSGELKSVARIRVFPGLPWKFDFSDKKVPPAWIGASYRHQPKELEGESLLVKISTIPKGTRSQAWIGPPHLHDYTIQADFFGTEANEKVPSMGLIAQRYTLDMTSRQELQIRSWTSRVELRFAKTVPFAWQPNTWYTMKFKASNEGEAAVLRGKVWKRGELEPSSWLIEAADATPNQVGSPGLFGNASDAEFYIDNVVVTPNK